MYDYIQGTLEVLNPAEAIVETSGIGFKILISLQTYSAIENSLHHTVKLYIHHYLREDDEQFYGFGSRDERELFELLISVNGIGPGTGRMMLSSLSSDELREAIIAQDVNRIKSVKGIGLKTAQRLILELKDKIVKGTGTQEFNFSPAASSPIRTEAATALVLLGFSKPAVDKVLDSLLKKESFPTLEALIKAALKVL